ncbi:RNA-binding protein 5-like protein [Angomonas deanei]|uniref:RNA recognition motif. (A.k.a. RRM, RBD, or RNP domain), putative n=1 Tax=Angomonas deanei TaxID=59799 RepID=A0A7G2CM89_9TRYP|nr:RNA-binding protein 5-like protein [Angomonas deanei]CAD2220539.1 RNA recognition motif. (a.k.a. RRM, RBD, or RNP domain), putative [Angomonas deanei]|eukprot:EPY24855.1 RNA-binding protein 5-like protein [Angomonas deanei]
MNFQSSDMVIQPADRLACGPPATSGINSLFQDSNWLYSPESTPVTEFLESKVPPTEGSSFGNSLSSCSETEAPKKEASPGYNLYVASLPEEFTDNDLFNLFAPFGKISSCKVMCRKAEGFSNKLICKGYGFVLFDNEEEANRAQAARIGYMVNGTHRIQVRHARATNSQERTPAAKTSKPTQAGRHPALPAYTGNNGGNLYNNNNTANNSSANTVALSQLLFNQMNANNNNNNNINVASPQFLHHPQPMVVSSQQLMNSLQGNNNNNNNINMLNGGGGNMSIVPINNNGNVIYVIVPSNNF